MHAAMRSGTSKKALFIENFSHGRILPVVCSYHKDLTFRHTTMNYGMENVPGNLCSHVSLYWMELNDGNWTIKRDPNVNLTEFAQLKRKFPGLKTLLTIADSGQTRKWISAMASTPMQRREFITDTVQLLRDSDLDGLDIFWKYLGQSDREGNSRDKVNYVSLLKELYSAFKKLNLLLTANVPINQTTLDAGYNIPAMNRYVDWMNVLGYDLRGHWNGRTDVAGPLHPRVIDEPKVAMLNAEQGLQALLDRGASKRKLILVVALYGRVYKLESENNTGLHAPIDLVNRPERGAVLKYRYLQAHIEICKNIQSAQWKRGFDEEGMCPYATNGQHRVGYEDSQSIARKVEFVRKEGYAGIMVSNCNLDDFRGVCGRQNVLLETVNNGIPRPRYTIVP